MLSTFKYKDGIKYQTLTLVKTQENQDFKEMVTQVQISQGTVSLVASKKLFTDLCIRDDLKKLKGRTFKLLIFSHIGLTKELGWEMPHGQGCDT